jgi:hypothetical protein
VDVAAEWDEVALLACLAGLLAGGAVWAIGGRIGNEHTPWGQPLGAGAREHSGSAPHRTQKFTRAPVGFSATRLAFELETDADEEQLAMRRRLTERYCVVYQTLASTPGLTTAITQA